MLTIASTTIALIIALIALREAQNANERAHAAENKAEAAENAAMTARVIHYHAPKPGSSALRLPEFIERLEAQNVNQYDFANYFNLADATTTASTSGPAEWPQQRAAGNGA